MKEKNKITERDILFSLWRGFYGLISINIIAISIDWSENSEYVKLRVYADSEASEEVFEDADVAYTDIIADYNFEKVYPIEAIRSNQPISDLENYKFIYYLRREESVK
jgi:hypothetical protein